MRTLHQTPVSSHRREKGPSTSTPATAPKAGPPPGVRDQAKSGPRKNVFSHRTARKDPVQQLAFSLDVDGWQERTLRLALTLYDSSRCRLKICKVLRETGQQHPNLPLKPVKGRRCSDNVCSCKIYYRKLTAPNMMGIDSSIVRACLCVSHPLCSHLLPVATSQARRRIGNMRAEIKKARKANRRRPQP